MKNVMKNLLTGKTQGMEFIQVLVICAVVLMIAIPFREQIGTFVTGLITQLTTMSTTNLFS